MIVEQTTSPLPTTPLVAQATFSAMVDDAIARHADRVALVDGRDGGSATYAELGRRIERIAAWLHQAGVGPGDRVALWCPNSPAWAGVALATMRVGAAVTGVNPAYGPGEARPALARAAVAVTTPDLAAAAIEAGVPRVVVLGAAGSEGTSLSEVLGCLHPAPPAVATSESTALVPYSSGTSGLPKAVLLDQANLAATTHQLMDTMGFSPKDVFLAVAPFFHVLGSMVNLLSPLTAGAKVVTMARFEPTAFLDLVEQHAVTVTAVPPPVAAYLASVADLRGHDLSSLQLVGVGGAPLTPSVQRLLEERLPGCRVSQGYGLTETAGCICVPTRAHPTSLGTVGRVAPATQLRVVDPESGRDVAEGGRGELWVRGPQVMRGYDDAAATAEVLDSEGWLRTGDLGYVTPEGDVVIVDRLKELIKVDGFQVAPAEVEAVLTAHPEIRDAAVVGRPDPRHGEVPVAFVTDAIDLGELQRWVGERLVSYKRPVEFHVVDSLPRSPSGKLLRRLLR